MPAGVGYGKNMVSKAIDIGSVIDMASMGSSQMAPSAYAVVASSGVSKSTASWGSPDSLVTRGLSALHRSAPKPPPFAPPPVIGPPSPTIPPPLPRAPAPPVIGPPSPTIPPPLPRAPAAAQATNPVQAAAQAAPSPSAGPAVASNNAILSDPMRQSFAAGAVNVMGSTIAGGMAGAMMSDRGERGKGFIGGAAAGLAGGSAFTAFSRHGASISQSAFNSTQKLFGKSETFQKHAGTMHKTLRGFHSAQGRNNMFRSGAMLSGGAFGLMFASNGRSHKRGFNRNRGNSITR